MKRHSHTKNQPVRQLPAAVQGMWPARPAGFGAALFDLNARIERRSGSAARRFNFRQFRFFEIDRLARWRTNASIDVDALAFGRAVASCAEPNVAAKWLARFCPALDCEVVDQLLEEAGRSPLRFTAGQLGNLLGVTPDERQNLDIRTIRPMGLARGEFQKLARDRKRENDRRRAEARRRAQGIETRRKGDSAAEEAAALGVDRRTIQRRKKRIANECRLKVADGYNSIRDFRAARPPSWLLRAFTVAPVIAVNDPGAPPEAARLGAIVGRHIAALRKVGVVA